MSKAEFCAHGTHESTYCGSCIEEGYLTKQKEINDFELKRKAAIEYCYEHLDKMWAARIVGIMLGCSFRDAKEHADIYFNEVEL